MEDSGNIIPCLVHTVDMTVFQKVFDTSTLTISVAVLYDRCYKFLYISCKEFSVFSMYEQWSGYVFFCIISTFHLPCTPKYDKYFDVSYTAFTIMCIYAKIHTHMNTHTHTNISFTQKCFIWCNALRRLRGYKMWYGPLSLIKPSIL